MHAPSGDDRTLVKTGRRPRPNRYALPPFPGIPTYDDCAMSTDSALKYDEPSERAKPRERRDHTKRVTGGRRPSRPSEKNGILAGREGRGGATADGPSDHRSENQLGVVVYETDRDFASDRRMNNDPTQWQDDAIQIQDRS